MTDRAPEGAREQAREARRTAILDAATRVFYARGVHEVGMDELVAATGLSKPAVYRVYASKDELIGGYLRRLADTIVGLIDEDARRSDPREALHSILRAIEEDLRRDTFRGCPFNNASAEFADPQHPARVVARDYRRELRARLATLSEALTGDPAPELADALAVLIDGAYVSAVHLGPEGPARSAFALGHRLIEEAAP